MKIFLLLNFYLFQQKILDLVNEILFLRRLVLARYSANNIPIYTEILKVRRSIRTFTDIHEIYQIVQAIIAVKRIKGDIAEVGVFHGGTSKIIARYKGNKSLFLFDTFEGFPKTSKKDLPLFRSGMFSSQYKEVKSHFTDEKKVYLYKGIFPQDTGKYIKNNKFSFVNLDVDLYESTLHCLQFFYPRINRGGIIISHDYSAIPAVHKAFHDFFKNKNEVIIGIFGSQCLVVKL